MTSEVEERIHRALATHRLERIEHGYRLVHPPGIGVGTLRLVPADEVKDGRRVIAIAEILAEYDSANLPSFHPSGVQRLNRMAVYGAYERRENGLRQTAKVSIYANEPAAHLVAQSILSAFGGQLPIGRSALLATTSAAALEQQRAHHAMPRNWNNPLDEASLAAATKTLQEHGLAASNDATSVWAELPMSGEIRSRTIDPRAETALLQVNTAIPHPIAGAGYLSTIFLPVPKPPADSAEICRRLNELDLEQLEFAPRLGAWGLHGPDDLPGYSCFFPSVEPLPGFHLAMMWWCARRAAWIRDRYWAAEQGIVLDGPTNGEAA